MSVSLLYIDEDYAERIERAGKTSTAKDLRDPEGFVRRIVKAQHLSLGRFASATFEVTCSLVTAAHICRHPFLSIVQQSFRYTKANENTETVIPCLDYLKGDNKKLAVMEYELSSAHAFQAYRELLNIGVKPEDARYVLPVMITTTLTVISNFQGWLDVCSLRTGKAAQHETREVFNSIFNILCQEAPAFFEYFKDDNKCAKKRFLVKEGE